MVLRKSVEMQKKNALKYVQMPLGAIFLTELRMCLMNFRVFNETKQENNQLPFK